MDGDEVVERAQQAAVGDGGFAAVGAGPQVVDVAADRRQVGKPGRLANVAPDEFSAERRSATMRPCVLVRTESGRPRPP